MEEINNKIDALKSAVEIALKWSVGHEDEIAKNSLMTGIKGVRRSVNTIGKSTKKRPSIAIFGQSQVGKSYLVQNLTKPDDSRFLSIKVSSENEDVNFLTEMNPDGGRESTGLVTRFTTSEFDNDPSHPFQIEIFGQLDIAAILLNSYWSDLKDYEEIDVNLIIDETKEFLFSLTETSEYQDVNEDDTFVFIQYVIDNFKDVYLIKEIVKSGLFSELQQKLPFINPNLRWQVLQLFWSKNKFITELFKLLSDEIVKLQSQRELRVDFGALSPNSTTILDVERVKELFNDDIIKNVSVKLPNNQVTTCDRSVISILTKEVQLNIANTFENDGVRGFMNTSDVLDFPGSKSREKIPVSVFNQNKTEQKLQLLIRGKVSFLFDSYTNNLGVSTLLYCMDDNPPEEKDAPHRLYKWVKKYIGDSPEDRQITIRRTQELLQKEGLDVSNFSPLFVVLTKFNQEINKVIPGKETSIETHDSKWFARIQENFVNFMMRAVEDKWASNWTSLNETFKYVFPVRDPMYSQASFSGYELAERETEVRTERIEALKAMKISFIGSDIVNNYILDSKKTWTEISTPNQSGIISLSEKLNYSAHPAVTVAKLEIELDRLSKELLSLLKPYLISGDIDKDLVHARTQAAKSFTSLISIANRNENLLPKLLSGLIISDTEIWNILYDYIFLSNEFQVKEETVEIDSLNSLKDLGVSIYDGMQEDDLMTQLREIYDGLDDNQIVEIVQEFIEIDFKVLIKQLNSNFNHSDSNKMTEVILSDWMNKMISISLESEHVRKLSDVQRESFRGIVNEIIKARERFGLTQIINETIDNIKIGSVSAEDIDLVASCITSILNKFTFSAGWRFCDEESKPISNRTSTKLFSEIGDDKRIEDLNFDKNSGSKDFLNEWSHAVKFLFEENVRFKYGFQKSFNSSRNLHLESLINSLEN